MRKSQQHIVRSEEVQDILSSPPAALVRVGSAVIGGILLIVLLGCCIFKYPDTISCEVTITNEYPPVVLKAKATGQLKELYISDGGHVNVGGMIAVIENPACTADVMRLDSLLSAVIISTDEPVTLEQEPLTLGSIQGGYSALIKAVTDYNTFVCNNLYDQRIQAEEAQLKPYGTYMSAMQQQEKITQRLHGLTDNNYQRERILHNKGLTSTADMESMEQTLLNSDMQREQMRTSMANTQIQIAQIKNNIAEFKLQKEAERRQLEATLLSALETVRNAITEWRQTYVLQSPISGIVSYNSLWQINQNVTAGDNTFSIVSGQASCVVGKAKVPLMGAGKVRAGQRVNIKLHSFPYLEYGFLTAQVTAISSMPDNDFYMATLSISSDMQTSYGKKILATGDLMGEADIVTEDLSITERMIGPLRYLWHRDFY